MVAAIRSDDLRSQNRARVLGAVRRSRVASRTDLGASTGLSPATISAITSDFIDEGILIPARPDGTTATGRGRPQVTLALNSESSLVCAVYFQLNKVSAIIVDYEGTRKSSHNINLPTLSASTEDIQHTLTTCIEKALSECTNESELCRIAVGFQGVIDAEGSKVLWSPICHQRNIPICDWLEQHFSVPTKVSNDCDLIAQALHWREPEKYGNNFGTVLLDNGVGMALYLRDDIVNGTYSSGVEFGHMTYMPSGALCRCGNRGCIEAYAGDYAISRRAKGQTEDTPPSDVLESPNLASILAAANNGDPDALAAINAAGTAIGTGLASLYALLDRFPVVLVGRGTLFFKHMEEALRSRLSAAPGYDNQPPVDIVCYSEVSPLVQNGGAVSALHLHDLELSANRAQLEVER